MMKNGTATPAVPLSPATSAERRAVTAWMVIADDLRSADDLLADAVTRGWSTGLCDVCDRPLVADDHSDDRCLDCSDMIFACYGQAS